MFSPVPCHCIADLVITSVNLSFLMGIWGSAFCATLAHYYKEVRPVIKGLSGFGGIDDLVEERNNDLIKLHPVDPGVCKSSSHCFSEP